MIGKNNVVLAHPEDMERDVSQPISPLSDLLPPHRLADDSAAGRIHLELNPDDLPEADLPRSKRRAMVRHDARFRASAERKTSVTKRIRQWS